MYLNVNIFLFLLKNISNLMLDNIILLCTIRSLSEPYIVEKIIILKEIKLQ